MLQGLNVLLTFATVAAAVFVVLVFSLRMRSRASKRTVGGEGTDASPFLSITEPPEAPLEAPGHPTQIEYGQASLEAVQLEALADELVEICNRITACMERGEAPRHDLYRVIGDLTDVSALVAEAHCAAIARIEKAPARTDHITEVARGLEQAA